MHRVRRIWILVPLLLVFMSGTVRAEAPAVALFLPGDLKSAYWKTVRTIAEAAARDFGITLYAFHGDGTRKTMMAQVLESFQRKPAPQYLILTNAESSAVNAIKIAKARGAKVFLYHSGLSRKEQATFFGPRQRLPPWIGGIFPDHLQAGAFLGKYLTQYTLREKSTQIRGAVGMIALAGPKTDVASNEMLDGLMRYAASDNRLTVMHQLRTDGTSTDARAQMGALFRKKTPAFVIWSTSDRMAQGAARATYDQGQVPGIATIIGSAGWSPVTRRMIEDGWSSIAVGGGLADAAMALAMVYDYHNGVDFKDLGLLFKSQLASLHAGNVNQIGTLLAYPNWDNVDFRRFSRVATGAKAPYRFGLVPMIKAAQGK